MNQDYNNIEIIIIDDCSRDNTENIINNLIKENSNIIRSYKFTKKVGAGQARQKGIYMSNGKYISKMLGVIEAPVTKMIKAYPREFKFMRHQTKRDLRPSSRSKK